MDGLSLINSRNVFVVILILFLLALFCASKGRAAEREVTILVTAVPHDDRTRKIAGDLMPWDFDVLENDKSQKTVEGMICKDQPIVLAVLIQDNLTGRVNNELKEIKNFIKSLPKDSRVMTGYITMGSLKVRQDFTEDKKKAADSLRILLSSDIATPFSPYIQVTDALETFRSQPKNTRRMIILISDGLDDTFGLRHSSPAYSIYLDQTIREAQKQGVAVYTIFAPSAVRRRFYRHAINYGQGSLLRLADETGGEAFFSGSDFVTFSPYFKEYNELLKYQWLITYQSTNTEKGFRKIEVQTDFDLHLHHPAGYWVK